MPDSVKTKKKLRSKDQETSEKIQTLDKLKQQYFNEGFTASKQRQRYLALKIIEIEHEIKNLIRIKNTIEAQLGGLDTLDMIEGKKGHGPQKTIPQGPEHVSKSDLESLYRKWEQGKKKPDTSTQRKEPLKRSKIKHKKIAYTIMNLKLRLSIQEVLKEIILYFITFR